MTETTWQCDPGKGVGVVVLGMGRSGTSSVAGLFVGAGFHLGRSGDHMPATPANPHGYAENLRTMKLNEAILERLEGSWFDPPTEDRVVVDDAEKVAPISAHVDDLLEEAEGRLIVVKDPRISVLAPFWAAAVGARLHPVLVIRDPLEVSLSLLARDETPRAFSHASWEIATMRTLRALAGAIVTVAPYRALLESPQLATDLVTETTMRLDPIRARSIRPEAVEPLDPDLHRNRLTQPDHDARLTARQQALWRWLDGLAPGVQRIDPPAALCRPTDAAAELVALETRRLGAVRLRDETSRELVALRDELHTARSAAAEAREELERAVRTTAAAEERAAQAVRLQSEIVAHNAQLEALVSEVVTSRSWRLTAPLRRLVGLVRRSGSTEPIPGT